MIDSQSLGIMFYKVAVSRLLNQSGDAVHRPAEWLLVPPVAVRCSILHRGQAVRVVNELKSTGAFRAEAALIHLALRITLDGDDLFRLREHQEAAPDGAIRAHTLGHRCSTEAGLRCRRARTHWLLLGHWFSLLGGASQEKRREKGLHTVVQCSVIISVRPEPFDFAQDKLHRGAAKSRRTRQRTVLG